MAFREVAVSEVLRAHLAGLGQRRVAEQAGVDRKTVRRYVQAAQEAGLVRDGGEDQLSDELIGQVVERVRPARPGGHGQAWQALEAWTEQITEWVGKGRTVVKIGILLERQGVVVPYRTLVRFATQRCGFGGDQATVRVADGEPGQELQVDFGCSGRWLRRWRPRRVRSGRPGSWSHPSGRPPLPESGPQWCGGQRAGARRCRPGCACWLQRSQPHRQHRQRCRPAPHSTSESCSSLPHLALTRSFTYSAYNSSACATARPYQPDQSPTDQQNR
jgi:transposase